MSQSNAIRVGGAWGAVDVYLQTQPGLTDPAPLFFQDLVQELLHPDRLHLHRQFSERQPRDIQQIIQHSRHCGGLPIQPLHQPGDAIIGDPQ